jgi:hypothetical protein
VILNPRFAKYTLWLMTGNTAPEAGQIEPALSLDGPDYGNVTPLRPQNWLTLHHDFIDWIDSLSLCNTGGLRYVD